LRYKGIFAFGTVHKAFNLFNAKGLTLFAQSDGDDLKSKACISKGTFVPLRFTPCPLPSGLGGMAGATM